MPTTAKHTPSLFQRVLDPVSGVSRLREEKARLEAFLAAMPGEYCGFSKDGSVIFSEQFAALLSLSKIENITDIQNALYTSDSAALEGQFVVLSEHGKPFSIEVKSQDEKKIFRLSGSRGQDMDGADAFDILWLEDITAQKAAQKLLEKNRDAAESESRRLQTAMDCLPQMMWMRDGDTNLTWCNKAYAAALGVNPATALAEQREIAVTKGKGPDAKALAALALASGKEQSATLHAIMNGKRCLIKISETPLPSSGQTLGMAQDISREEDLEKQMMRMTAANKELLEQLRTSIALFGPEQKLEFYNSAFTQLWGLDDPWLNAGPKLGDIMEKLRENRKLPEQADFRKYKDSWLKMFTGLLHPHEDMLYLPDGAALRMLVIPNPAGGLIITFEDVTSRLALESSYNTLIEVQRETLDNLAEGVAVFGGDGRLKLWNPAFAKLWGLIQQDLEGEPHINVLVDKIKNHFDTANWDALRPKIIAKALDHSTYSGRLQRKDGSLLDYATVPLPDGGVLISYYDVTDSVQVENALREKNAALETAEKLKMDFLANVSYQLRTPLNAIVGFNDILDQQYFGPLNEKQREYTMGISEAGQRLISLIDDILDLSSLEAGVLELEKSTWNIHAMLQGIYTLTEAWGRSQRLDFRLDCPVDIGEISADERRMKQALINLLRNAFHFTPEMGTITLRAVRDKKNIIFSVSDTGVGIPQKELSRIFEPFERIQTSSDSSSGQRGAGLGLTLVRNIIRLHNGTVDIESVEGKGTTVTMTVPV